MKYMLLIYHEEQAWHGLSERRGRRFMLSTGSLRKRSWRVVTISRAPSCTPCSTATSVRVRDGKQLATDGPFAETKEQLGGYYLIEAGDLDEAIGIAARIPSAQSGTIEVRPVAEAERASDCVSG